MRTSGQCGRVRLTHVWHPQGYLRPRGGPRRLASVVRHLTQSCQDIADASTYGLNDAISHPPERRCSPATRFVPTRSSLVDHLVEPQRLRKCPAFHLRWSAVSLFSNVSLGAPAQPRQRPEHVYFMRPGISGQTSDDKSPIGLVLGCASVGRSAVRRQSSIYLMLISYAYLGVENLTFSFGFQAPGKGRRREAHPGLMIMPIQRMDIDDLAMSILHHHTRGVAHIRPCSPKVLGAVR